MVIHSDPQQAALKISSEGADVGTATENLALLYQGLFTGIVRLQSRRQQLSDADSFRRRTSGTLQDIERAARSAGYDTRDVTDAHFAVVAFLDSVVLNSNDPVRAEWERKTLQEELFGKTDAGVVFFEKLENLNARRDSQQLADILEVYLLCLLLGFQGRYSGVLRGEVDVTMERLRTRIDAIRGHRRVLSPCSSLPVDVAAATPAPTASYRQYAMVALAAAVVTLILFLLLHWNLTVIGAATRARLVQ